MRVFWAILVAALFSLAPPDVTCQQPTGAVQRDSQALTLLTQAHGILNAGNIALSDLTLSGNISWIAGSTTVNGSVALQAKGLTESRFEIVGGTPRIEIRDNTAGPAGQVVDFDGAVRQIATHNCWTPPIWFAPALIVQSALSFGGGLRYIGLENWNGVAVTHLQQFQAVSGQKSRMSETIQSLSAVDLYFDVNSHLLLGVAFNFHPDDDYSQNIPVEVRFSDYRSANGVATPFHIQRLLAGSLNADITISTVSINSGLSDSSFQLQ